MAGGPARLEKLPEGYIGCVWCGAGNRKPRGTEQTVCFRCGLDPMPGEDPTKDGKVNPAVARKASRNRLSTPKKDRLDPTPTGFPVIGIDPGARYTGVVVRDGDAVLHASTLVRPQEMNGTDWAVMVVADVQKILRDFPRTIPVAIEGISDPKGFHKGKRAAINPKDIIRAGIVLGALVATWPTAEIVPAGGNGSQHYTHYPSSLIGRRPADLPGSTNGAGTRDHEQSAYDVAGKASRTRRRRSAETISLQT
jgi:hypothetical protein